MKGAREPERERKRQGGGRGIFFSCETTTLLTIHNGGEYNNVTFVSYTVARSFFSMNCPSLDSDLTPSG